MLVPKQFSGSRAIELRQRQRIRNPAQDVLFFEIYVLTKSSG